MKKTVLLLVIILIIFSSVKIYGFSGENPFGMNLTVPEYWFDKDSTYSFSGDSVYRNIYKGMLDSAQTMGIVWWRAQYRFRWNDVEPIPGSFVFTDEDSIVKWTSDNRMHMLPVIGNTAKWAHHLGIPNSDSVYWTRYPPDDSYWSDYTKYIKAIVERYDGDGIDDVEIPNFIPIKYWQIMNEPYGYYFLGTQDQYEYMFVKTYEAIKEADPEAKVLGPCLTSINPKDSTYQGPLWWEYYDVNGDSIANEWYNPDIKCLHWQKRIKNFLDYTTEHSVDISDIILAHHLYHLNDSINYKYLQEVIDSLDIWYPGENIPVWITETGYKWHNSITIESTNIVFNPDIIDSNFVCEKTYWFDHSKPFRHVPLIDTVLTPGESIWVNTPTKVNKWYVFNGEYIISCDTSLHDTILFPNDTIHFLHHRFMINTLQNIIDTSYQCYDSCSLLTKTLETQDNYYTGFINRIFNNPSIANRLKIFFFDLTPTIRKSPNDTFPGNVYARIIKYTDGTIKLVKSHYMSSLTLFDYINGKHYAFYTLKDSITNPPLAICNAPVITNIEYENNLLKVYWQNNSFNSSANYVGVIDTINNDTISFRYISQFAESLITDTIIIPGWYKIRVSTYMQHDTAWYSDYETYYIGDTTSPYINIQIPLNPDIAGNYHTLHWQAYDTISAIKSQKLILDNDTTNLNKDVRQYQIQKGTYNGWYNILPKLEVEDYGRNYASDSDSVRVALFDEDSNDFNIDLHFSNSNDVLDSESDKYNRFGMRYLYLSSIFPSDCIFYVIYYRKNNDPWKIKTSKGSGYRNVLLDSTTNLRDKFTAFSYSYLWNGNVVFNHYSNICSIGEGITPDLFSYNGSSYIFEYELFTPDRTDNAILLRNNALIGNNFKFRIINSDKNTYIDNIKLYAIDSKRDISLKDTKDEISTTNSKSIKTALEQESFDSKLSSIDDEYYILNPNDTFDFIFKNIDRKLSEGYTRNYVMEITGYQADDTIDFISGIADKRKKLLKNDVRMIRSVGISLKIEFSSIREREINLKVCDLSGRILRNEKIDLSKGRKNYLIESLPQGVYLIKADNKSFKGIILK